MACSACGDLSQRLNACARFFISVTVRCGPLDSWRNPPISVTLQTGCSPRDHARQENLSCLTYTVQFKLIGKHFSSFSNVNHKWWSLNLGSLLLLKQAGGE